MSKIKESPRFHGIKRNFHGIAPEYKFYTVFTRLAPLYVIYHAIASL